MFILIFIAIALISRELNAVECRNGSLTDDSGKIVSLFVLFRNGDRGPTSSFANDNHFKPEYWPDGYGQLTESGIKRSYNQGQWLRDRYKNFLSDNISPKEVQIFSVDSDRNLMSAAAVVAGLFPPKGKKIWNQNLLWRPAPIHSSPTEADEIFPDKDNCKKYKKEYKEVKQNDHFTEIKKEYASLFADLSKKTGSTIDSIKGVKEVRDVFYCYENYDKSYLPSWASNVNRNSLEKVTSIYLERFSYTDKLKKYSTGPFFHKIISHFDKATNSTKAHKKLYMVSGHESEIVSVLDSLGAYDFRPPEFSATIIFELKTTENNKFHINVYYKESDEVKQIKVSDCDSNCEYAKFKKVVDKYSISYDSWKDACD